MEKYFIGDDADKNQESKMPTNNAELRSWLSTLSISAHIQLEKENKAVVLVEKNIGTTMLFANISEETFLLRKLSHKVEDKGSTVLYHIKWENV
jgi:hypothetical protein